MVRIVSLIDNISDSPGLRARHGLSVYIETPAHRILFDTGPDSSFLSNAEGLGIDLSAVDTVIISHGHFDHGGGLKDFLRINPHASVYIRSSSFEPYYTKVLAFRKYIGLDRTLKTEPKLIFTGDETKIDGELTLFSGVTGKKLLSSVNDSLFVKNGNRLLHDSFGHEQYLIIRDGENQILLTGCSHTGILNIVEKFNREYRNGGKVTVIGGFHLYDIARRKYEEEDKINALSHELVSLSDAYYTCHCTGKEAYGKMKARMSDKLAYLAAGNEIII